MIERADEKPLSKRNAAVRRLRSLAWSTTVVTTATVLGLAGAGGTYALLQDTTSMPGATVQAGTLDLRINGQASAALGSWELSPAAGQVRTFTVTNTGNVAANLSASAAITSQQAIGTHTQARLTPVTSVAQCRTGLAGSQGALNGYSVAALDTIAAGQTKTYCLELSLASNTPVTLAGQGVSFSLTVNAAQREG